MYMLCFNFIRGLIWFSFQFLGLKQNEKNWTNSQGCIKLKHNVLNSY